MSHAAAEAVRQKLLLMDEQIKFLEFIWNDLPQKVRDTYINDYIGRVPYKYNK